LQSYATDLALDTPPPNQPSATGPYFDATAWLVDIMAIDSSYSSRLISELDLENQMSEHSPSTTSTHDRDHGPNRSAHLGNALSVAPQLLKEVPGSFRRDSLGIANDATGPATFPQLALLEDSAHAAADIAPKRRY
jgi:hypothetical protein